MIVKSIVVQFMSSANDRILLASHPNSIRDRRCTRFRIFDSQMRLDLTPPELWHARASTEELYQSELTCISSASKGISLHQRARYIRAHRDPDGT